MAGNWDQILNYDEERQRQRSGPNTMPFPIVVKSVSSESELAVVEYYKNRGRNVNIVHPYVSLSSWIRAMPESGTSYIASFRSDESPPQMLNTYQRGTKDRVEAYRKQRNVYRPLTPGEIEISSRGVGQIFAARRPHLETRAGALYNAQSQDLLSTYSRAPQFNRQFLQHRSGSMNDEERMGLLIRHDNGWKQLYPKIRGNFCAEWYIDLENPANESPSRLFTLQRGHVLDSAGTQIRHEITNLPLRVYDRYYANDDSQLIHQIDEDGNVYTRLADAATVGYRLEVPNGFYEKKVARDETVTIDDNRYHVIGKNANYTVGDNCTWEVNKNIYIESVRGGQRMVYDSATGKRKWYVKTPGHLFALDDTDGKEAVYLIHKSGGLLNFDEKGNIKLATTGGNSLYFNEVDGQVSVIAKGKAYLSIKDNVLIGDGSGKSTIDIQSGKIQIASSGDLIGKVNTTTFNTGQVYLGNSKAELVDILHQTLITLSTTTAAGFNFPLSSVGNFAALATKLALIKKV